MKRKAEEIDDTINTINVVVTSAEDGPQQLPVRLNDNVFEKLEAELGRRLLSVHLGDHHEVTEGSTFGDEDIGDDCSLKVVYGPTGKEELRAFTVDVLCNHLIQNNVDLDTAGHIADELVKIYPSFESLFDHTNNINLAGWDVLEHTLNEVTEFDRDVFRHMLDEEGKRRGIQIQTFSAEEIRQFLRQKKRMKLG